MIFYFSGTGNSLYAAKYLARHNNVELVSIAAAITKGDGHFTYSLKDREIIGFVYPVYAWGPPGMVLEFIKKLKLGNYRDNYIFSVATCGASIGNTMKILEEALRGKGFGLNSGFSVKMPNNYIIMGDVDAKEAEKEKMSLAEEKLKNINKLIEQQKAGVFDLEKGFLPRLLTGIINPMFNKYALRTAGFYVNDHCTGCGICAEVCNCGNIIVKEKPRWGERCSQCLACIHYCPQKAVQYGKSTVNKGRYTNPYVSLDEIRQVKQ